ncbi:MAG: DUF6259 domain-containing protein [Candidatus Poribacteria bacterium]|nr:DUF6259 domain-containing protein [Candidatus Poribacteria bacterium]
MRDFWIKCVCILLLKFVLVPAALSNTLTFNEQGEVFAETDRYQVRFEHGVLTHFHNKLTQETYTQGDILGNTQMKAGRGLGTEEFVPEIKRGPSPFECELIYRDSWSVPRVNEVMLHLFIGIDVETGDLLIRQKGFSKTGGIERIMWGFGNLSESVVDVIAPILGGQVIVNSDRYHYPRKWQTPLVILQGQSGGVFVRSSDTQFRFKSLEYFTEGHSFLLNFWEVPFAPFEAVETITTATWRLNAYQGNWEVPALAYREWMNEALKPVNRAEMPAWANDINLIIFHSNIDRAILPILNRLVDPKQTLIHIHQWRHGGHDGDLPTYTPDAVKPEFADFVKDAHRYGFKVMAHVNMIGISEDHPFYAAFEKYHVRDPYTGEKTGWHWEDRHTNPDSHAFVNPASSEYRKMFVNILKTLWERYQVDAFHLDISSPVYNDKNGLIDGLTYAEGNILLHQELRKAIPGIVLGGEEINDVTFLHESFAQISRIPPTEQPHPISSFLFSPYTTLYGRYLPNPDRRPDEYQKYFPEYDVWNILLTIRVIDYLDFAPHRVEIHKLLELARERQNYRFGDVNDDGVVNIQDLVIVANALGKAEPDLNGDGVVNIQDLVIVANAFGN